MLYIEALDRDQMQYIYIKKQNKTKTLSFFFVAEGIGRQKIKMWGLVYNTHLSIATFLISTCSVWLVRKVIRRAV